MGNAEKVSLQDFVSEQVSFFLSIKKEAHLGVLLYNVKDFNLSSLLDEGFRNEFKKNDLDIEVVVSEDGLERYSLFHSGTDPLLSIDKPGYYPIDIEYFLDSLDPKPRFNVLT